MFDEEQISQLKNNIRSNPKWAESIGLTEQFVKQEAEKV